MNSTEELVNKIRSINHYKHAINAKIEALYEEVKQCALPLPKAPITMLPHQESAFRRLCAVLHYNSAALCDEYGLGKTFTALQLLRHFARRSSVFLVLAPKQLLGNWIAELERLECDDLQPYVYTGSERQRKDLKRSYSGQNLILCTATSLRDYFLRRMHFKIAVIDEVHLYQRCSSRFYKQVRRLQCRRYLVMTGTPLQCHLEGVALLCQFVVPEVCAVLESAKNADYSNVAFALLMQLLRHYYVRRTLSVLEVAVPAAFERIERVLAVPAAEYGVLAHTSTADALAADICVTRTDPELVREMRSRFPYGVSALIASGRLTNLALLELSGEFWRLSVAPRTQSIAACLEKHRRENAANGVCAKALIFTYYVEHARYLTAVLPRLGTRTFMFTGEIEHEVREDVLRAFRGTNEHTALVMTYYLGNVGLNLTQATLIILADFGHNPNAIQQAISRAVRIGQQHSVEVVWIVGSDDEAAHLEKLRRLMGRNQRILEKTCQFAKM